jgi:hypothetical protein
VSSSQSGNFVDQLGGSTHSLEEWLKASGNYEGVRAGTSKKAGNASLSGDGNSFSSAGYNASEGVTTEKPDHDSTSSLERPPDGRRSISPIDSDTSYLGDISRDQLDPASRPLSAHYSSIDGSSANLKAELTDEEKFDEEYGELFDIQRNSSVDSEGYEVEFGHEDSDLKLSGQAAEQQRLLSKGGSHTYGYDAVGTAHNQEKKDRHNDHSK